MGNLTFDHIMKSLAIFDPSRVLIPAEALVPDPTHSALVDPTSTNARISPSIQPARIPKPDLPLQTGDPLPKKPAITPNDPAASTFSDADDPHNENGGNSVHHYSNSDPPKQSGEASQDPPSDPHLSNPDSADPKSSQADMQGQQSSVPVTHQSAEISASEFTALTLATKESDAPGTNSLPQDPPLLIPGGDILPLDGPKPDVDPVLSVAGLSFTAAATGFPIADTKILPGSPAVTVSGTPISLDAAGMLLFGSSPYNFLIPDLPVIMTVSGTISGTATPIGFSNIHSISDEATSMTSLSNTNSISNEATSLSPLPTDPNARELEFAGQIITLNPT